MFVASAARVRRCLVTCAAVAVAVGLALPGTASAQEPAEASGPSLLCPDPPPSSQVDDRADISDPHVAAVDCLFHLGISSGLGHDEGVRYLPDAVVRRDQMASFVVQALEAAGAGLPAGDAERFADVSEGNVHRESIGALASTGMVEGTSASTYAPDRVVSRDAMASFLVRAAAWYQDRDHTELAGGPTRFGDIEGSVHADAIAGAYHLGITQGVASDAAGASYAPDRPVTREQMASFLTAATEAMLDAPGTCVNHELAATVSYPQDWATNPGTVLPRCSLFDEERFVPDPGTEIDLDRPIRLLAADVALEEAENEGREQLERSATTVDGQDALFLRQRTTEESDELLPPDLEIATYLVELPPEADGSTLIASTNSTSDEYDSHRAVLEQMMSELRFTVPTRATIASFEGGGRPFEVVAFPAADGVCTQARAGTAVDTVCVDQQQMDELELRSHLIDDGFTVHAGSVAASFDTVEIVGRDGDVHEPGLTRVGDRLVYASPIAEEDIDVVRARGDGEVVEGDLPE